MILLFGTFNVLQTLLLKGREPVDHGPHAQLISHNAQALQSCPLLKQKGSQVDRRLESICNYQHWNEKVVWRAYRWFFAKKLAVATIERTCFTKPVYKVTGNIQNLRQKCNWVALTDDSMCV